MIEEHFSFLLFPIINNTETLRAYMARTAHFNGAPRLYPRTLYAFTDINWFLRSVTKHSESSRDKLHHRLVIDQKSPAGLPEVLLGNDRIPAKHICIQARRVCPHCLRETGWSRGEWEIKSFRVCPKHRVHLVTECGRCLKRLTWNSSELLHCYCGYSLAANHASVAKPIEVSWSRRIQSALRISFGDPTESSAISKTGQVQLSLGKLVFTELIVRSLLIPSKLDARCSPAKIDELAIQILTDDFYRPYLWESIFLHAAGNPMEMANNLRLNLPEADLTQAYMDLMPELMLPRALAGIAKRKTRPSTAEQRTRSILQMKKEYRAKVAAGLDPFFTEGPA